MDHIERQELCKRVRLEIEKVIDALQLNAHKLDYIREPILQQDRVRVVEKIGELKQSDGESWAIGEAVERILRIKDTEDIDNNYRQTRKAE